MKIKNIFGREIIDSRGNPTVEAVTVLESGIKTHASVPSGASTGRYEAHELIDGDESRYHSRGVTKAVNNINSKIFPLLCGMNSADIGSIDYEMIRADGTNDKSVLGANAVLAVSLSCARAAARAQNLPLYKFIGGVSADTLPVPMMNILNGGAHAANNIDIQEFMIVPTGACCFKEALRMCCEVYYCLKTILKEDGLSVAVGDEGGFAPDLESSEAAIEYIIKAIERAGYKAGSEFYIAIDAAASEWKGNENGKYLLPKSNSAYNTDELIDYWEGLCKKYPVISIEDALDEEDWEGFRKLTERIGSSVQLVGDDLFVTNTKRIEKGIAAGCANSVLIKPNQIGTLTEAVNAIRLAKRSGYTSIVSHRSGETEDTFIADLAVALNTGQIKTGAPCRSERTAKYNRLLRIEQELGKSAKYMGINAFNVK